MNNEEGRAFSRPRMRRLGSNAPNPCSPDPALFETAVRFLTSFLFARAPMRVSGVPQSPNPRQRRKEGVTPVNVYKIQTYGPPLSNVSPDLTSLIASSTESQTLRLRGTGVPALAFKNLNVCVGQAAGTCAWFTRVMWARCATVDGCRDIDLRNIFCEVVMDIVQVPRTTFNTCLSTVLRIMIMVRYRSKQR